MAGNVQSIERAAAIVRLLTEHGQPMGLTEIAGSLALAKPTVHGLLATMVAVGFVDKDPTTAHYAPGAAFGPRLRGPIDPNRLRASAIDHADSLAAGTGQAVRVGVLEGSLVRVVHHVFAPGRTGQVLDVNTLLPADAYALGKVLLAYRAQPGRAARGTSEAAPVLRDEAALARELHAVRQQGWAGDVTDLRRGEAGLAVPVRSGGGLVIGAIGITGDPDHLLGADQARTASRVASLNEVAHAISTGIAARR